MNSWTYHQLPIDHLDANQIPISNLQSQRSLANYNSICEDNMYKCLKFLCNLMKLIHPTMQCWDNAFAESLWKCLKDFKQKKTTDKQKVEDGKSSFRHLFYLL